MLVRQYILNIDVAYKEKIYTVLTAPQLFALFPKS
jgi:hypothetical protein